MTDKLATTTSAGPAQKVRTVLLIGPPRSGTTLLAQLLGGGPGILSLSEPFLVHAVAPPWRLHRFFSRFQRSVGLIRVAPPRVCTTDRFFAFLREIATRNSLPVLVVKETFRDIPRHRSWHNVELLTWLASSADRAIGTVRHPYDTTASAIKLLRGFVGFRGWLSEQFIFPDCPRFADTNQLVRWFSHNWVRCVDWARGHCLTLVRYEDLVEDPSRWLGTICRHCDLPFDERTLDHRQRPTAFGGVGAPEVLKRPAKPVHSRSIGRGRKLTPPQREIVRQICGPGALELGYSL